MKKDPFSGAVDRNEWSSTAGSENVDVVVLFLGFSFV